jgi:tRNA pseudouridine13 synthase
MSDLPRATLKASPEDFVVDEVPLYEPSGTGSHLYVRFRKRDLTTDFAVRGLARAVGADARDAGIPGMKDRFAVTTQTVSLALPRGSTPDDFVARVRGAAVPGLEVLDARWHGNKLRTGHLAGNRFRIVLRDLDPAVADAVVAAFERIGREGAPNFFGEQRFGRDGDNADRARAWLSGREAPPRDHRLKKLLVSSLQAELFNEVLARRLARGDWDRPLLGDVLRKEESGGLFLCEDPAADAPRAAAFEVCPTGPIPGPKMKAPTGVPLEIEHAVLAERLGEGVDLGKAGPLAEGTRRAFRVPVRELRAALLPPGNEKNREISGTREDGRACVVEFVLPKGAFATTVVGCVIDARQQPARTGAPPEPPEASEA